MKPIKLGLRIWIAIISLFSFLGGWALFSHSGKPAPLIPTSSTAGVSSSQLSGSPTLPPIPSLQQLTSNSANSGNSSGLQPLPQLQPNTSSNFFPPMMTRGS